MYLCTCVYYCFKLVRSTICIRTISWSNWRLVTSGFGQKRRVIFIKKAYWQWTIQFWKIWWWWSQATWCFEHNPSPILIHFCYHKAGIARRKYFVASWEILERRHCPPASNVRQVQTNRIFKSADLLAFNTDIFEDKDSKSFSQLLIDVARDQVIVGARWVPERYLYL